MNEKAILKLDEYDLRQFCFFNHINYSDDPIELREYLKSYKLSKVEKKELNYLTRYNLYNYLLGLIFPAICSGVFSLIYFMLDFNGLETLIIMVIVLPPYFILEIIALNYRSNKYFHHWDSKSNSFDDSKMIERIIQLRNQKEIQELGIKRHLLNRFKHHIQVHTLLREIYNDKVASFEIESFLINFLELFLICFDLDKIENTLH